MATARIVFEVTTEVRDNLDRMRNRIGAKDYAAVIRNALALYDFALEKKAEGGEIVARMPPGDYVVAIKEVP